MAQVTKRAVTDVARKEAERAMNGAEQRAEGAKSELGRIVFDVAEEYFPEASRARRRRDAAMGFFAGLATGFGLALLASIVGRR